MAFYRTGSSGGTLLPNKGDYAGIATSGAISMNGNAVSNGNKIPQQSGAACMVNVTGYTKVNVIGTTSVNGSTDGSTWTRLFTQTGANQRYDVNLTGYKYIFINDYGANTNGETFT
jgi:hypothetical protein